MKTYPYHTPEGIIELVEQREYDETLKLALQLANLRAEDMATIKEMREAIREVFHSFADDPPSDASWLLDDRQNHALAKLYPFTTP